MTKPVASPRTPAWWRALRPRQWVKNVVLLAGIIFTLDQQHPWQNWLRVFGAVALFCALSSAIYLVNDASDAEQDRLHPKKRLRPIAAGELSVQSAWMGAALLMIGGLAAACFLGWGFTAVAVSYLVLTTAYTYSLKHEVVMDVMALALCYVVRAAAGAVVISVEISPWLLICTFLGALVIGLAKRRSELLVLDKAAEHRPILGEYSIPMLDQMIGITTSATLVVYMLYTFFSPTAKDRPLMMLTIPFVVYGLLRFLYLTHRKGTGGDPTSELPEDRPLLICGFLWMATCALVMWWGRNGG